MPGLRLRERANQEPVPYERLFSHQADHMYRTGHVNFRPGHYVYHHGMARRGMRASTQGREKPSEAACVGQSGISDQSSVFNSPMKPGHDEGVMKKPRKLPPRRLRPLPGNEAVQQDDRVMDSLESYLVSIERLGARRRTPTNTTASAGRLRPLFT